MFARNIQKENKNRNTRSVNPLFRNCISIEHNRDWNSNQYGRAERLLGLFPFVSTFIYRMTFFKHIDITKLPRTTRPVDLRPILHLIEFNSLRMRRTSSGNGK